MTSFQSFIHIACSERAYITLNYNDENYSLILISAVAIRKLTYAIGNHTYTEIPCFQKPAVNLFLILHFHRLFIRSPR